MNDKETSFATVDGSTENVPALLPCYNRFNVGFTHGEGAFLFDTEGKKYLDFICGIAVTCFGHNHPEIKAAVIEQLGKLWHTSNLFKSDLQEKIAAKLAEISGLDYVFFSNSGTEAVEAAIKFARKWGKGRYHIITAYHGFHGRTMGSLSATGQNKIRDGFAPFLPGFSYCDFGDIQSLEKEYSKYTTETVAVMLEPIQGESGIIIPPEGYLKEVREFCTKNGLLLIMDEIQSGMGRTGKFFAHQHEAIIPDIITTAKGIANGIPAGAIICTEEIGRTITPGSHGTTFGGNPLAMAAAEVVLGLLNEELLSYISQTGATLKRAIELISSPSIKTVRGRGLMIGIELREGLNARTVAEKLIDNGILVGTAGNSVLRVLPPYIITENEIIQFTIGLKNTLEELESSMK